MVGLSVPRQPSTNAPIAETLSLGSRIGIPRQTTHQLQHIAFNVKAGASMEAVKAGLERAGLLFMTDVLTYHDDKGASIRQLFIQRVPNVDGQPYGGFDPDIIDDLYRALDKQIGARVVAKSQGWVPPQVTISDA